MSGLDSMNGSTYGHVLWALGEVTASQKHILTEIALVRQRLDQGEVRMDFHAEENIRRQAEIREIIHRQQAAEAITVARSERDVGIGARMAFAVLDFVKDLLGDKRDLRRWIALLILAWAVNRLHLPREWHDALLHVSANGE